MKKRILLKSPFKHVLRKSRGAMRGKSKIVLSVVIYSSR